MTRYSEKLVEAGFFFSAVVSASITFFILLFMIVFSLPLFKGGHVFQVLRLGWDPYKGTFGVLPMIVGTGGIASLALVFAAPIGVGCSALISVFSRRGFGRFLRKIVEFMAGIATVIYGFIAISLLILFIREISIKTTGPVLGISRFQNIVHILTPYNISSIMSGVILALGRCAEDTAVIMLTGAVAMVGIPTSLLSSYEALPFYIFHISSEFSSQEELMTGYAPSIILLGICALLFTLTSVLKGRVASRFAALRNA